jgi:uncharacterized protein YeaO (DUF488 family)
MHAQRETILVKRVYEPPTPEDGYRVLMGRLWPRGMRKQALALDLWDKELGASDALRWYGNAPVRWRELPQRYRAELRAQPESWRGLVDLARKVC